MENKYPLGLIAWQNTIAGKEVRQKWLSFGGPTTTESLHSSLLLSLTTAKKIKLEDQNTFI